MSLPQSNFEIDTDANLVVDDPAPSIDWVSVPPAASAEAGEVRKADDPSGASDTSFGNGTKEDTAVPSVVDGGIPPNKSDLLNFGVTVEETADGSLLHMFWHRVQEPSGTTNMDFEFNQSTTLSSNGVTPVRTAGDLLIQYDLAQGGTTPKLFLSRWVTTGPKSQCEAANSTPCWSTKVDLTAAGDATGSINNSAIPAAESDGLGAISARTFGEATVDMSAIVTDPNVCFTIGSAYLKSRSSDSFTAALKDFIPPASVNISNCGSITISKTDAPEGDGVEGAVFRLCDDAGDDGACGAADDCAVADAEATCTTDATGVCTMDDVLAGDYCLFEEVPIGYLPDSNLPLLVTVDADENVQLGVVNPQILTDILCRSEAQIDDATESTIVCTGPDGQQLGSNGPDDPAELSITDLPPGTYDCQIVISVPAAL